MRRFLLYSGCFLLAASVPAPAAPAKAQPSHLLVQMVKEKTGFRVVKTTVVNSALPKQRDRSRSFAWKIRVTDGQEKTVFERGMDDPTWVRGEFRNNKDPDKIDGYRVKRKDPIHFSIRLPRIQASRIHILAIDEAQTRKLQAPDDVYTTIGSVDFPSAGDVP